MPARPSAATSARLKGLVAITGRTEPLEMLMVDVKLREDPGTDIRVVYLIDMAVGRSSANRRDDVLLVQFFLNAMWGKLTDKKIYLGLCVASGRRRQSTVFVGPSLSVPSKRSRGGTGRSRRAAALSTDASTRFRSGSMRPGRFLHRYRVYTILGLNVNFGFTFGVDRHARLSKEPNFPLELKPRLFV